MVGINKDLKEQKKREKIITVVIFILCLCLVIIAYIIFTRYTMGTVKDCMKNKSLEECVFRV